MSKRREDGDIGQWLQLVGGWITSAIGFVTVVLGFVQLVQGDARLPTLTLLSLGIGLVLLTCFYYAVLWRPERQDGSAQEGEPNPVLSPEEGLEEQQGQKQRRRKLVRRMAIAGLILVPLLTLGGYGGWQYVQSLPTDEIVILVAEFDGPREEDYRVTETILTNLQAATKDYDAVQVKALGETVTAQQGSDKARQLGEQRNAAIVIWGGYGNAEVLPLSVNFEVLQPTEYLPVFDDTVSGAIQEVELSELETFQLQPRLSSEMSYLTLFVLGIAEYEAKDWMSAIASFDKALSQVDMASKSLDSAVAFFYKGNSHFFGKQLDGAITAYDAAFKIKPDYYEAIYNKATVLYEQGQYDAAIATYDAALKIKPDYYEAIHSKGNALTEQGRYDEAIAAYDAALKIQPDFHKALYNKGYVLYEQGQYDRAVTAYDAVLKIQPDDHEALHSKGDALYEQGQYDEAITAYDAALKIQPDDHESFNNKGNALSERGQYDEAIAAYDAALKIQPDDYEALYNKGNALSKQGQYDDAIAAYSVAFQIKPDYYEAIYNKGLLLIEIKQYERAIATFNAAVKIQPKNPGNYYNLARCHAVLNQVSPALENIKKLLEILPEVKTEFAASTDFDNIRDDPRFKELMASK